MFFSKAVAMRMKMALRLTEFSMGNLSSLKQVGGRNTPYDFLNVM